MSGRYETLNEPVPYYNCTNLRVAKPSHKIFYFKLLLINDNLFHPFYEIKKKNIIILHKIIFSF